MLRLYFILLFVLLSSTANAYERSVAGDKELVEIAIKALGQKPEGKAYITHEGKFIRVTFGEAIYVKETNVVVPDGSPPSVLINPFESPPKVKEVYKGM
jgi:ABC-type histidine transport system ATPase subunit